jgi:hypothetical protein
LDDELTRLTDESQRLDGLVKHAQEIEKKVDDIDKWAASDIDWLGELYRLSTEFPPAEAAMVTQLRAGSRPVGGELQLEGLVKDAATIDQMEKGLRDPQHAVEQKAGQQNTKHPRYRWAFKSSVFVENGPEMAPADDATARTASAKGPAPIDRVTPGNAVLTADGGR